MTKATIKQLGDRTVSLSYDDEMTGERVTREFWVPRNDGTKYVREDNTQVCDGLSSRGHTLSVQKAEDLLPLIRAEWKAAKAAERKAKAIW